MSARSDEAVVVAATDASAWSTSPSSLAALSSPTPRRRPSIRRALLLRLTLPLLALAAAGSLSTYFLAQYFSQRVLDQWLYDSAIALSNQVRSVNGRARLELPRPALDILEWDVVDRFFYEVSSSRQGPLLANARLPMPSREPPPDGTPVYFDARAGQDSVRAVAITLTLPSNESLTIKVAETRHKRNEQATQVLTATLLVSIALVISSASLVWFAVGSGMHSLETAIRRIRLQHSKAASPTVSIAQDDDEPVPQEVQPLVDEIHLLVGELSAAHRSNQRFVGNTAHQLRTPIAALRVQLESSRRQHDAAAYAKAVDRAIPELTRLTHLLHQLLTLARVDEDQAELLELSSVDLAGLARQEVERHFDAALAAHVDIGYDGPNTPLWVQGKDALLREVIGNLIDNAILYGKGDEAHVTVGVTSNPPEVYVEDQGHGIPAQERERVRERYYRVAGNDADGSGLGLAIVDEIAQRHGARFVLETGSGGSGLKARFVFPA